MPTVSICLPVYNGAKYLGFAIESVLDQTYQDFELLISDDCSSDATLRIVQDYGQRDERIKHWINVSKLGHYPNYNAGIERSSGKYIKLFAQDDVLYPGLLKKFVSVLDENPNVTLVNCARHWIDADGKLIIPKTEIDLKLTKLFTQDTILSGTEAIISTLKEGTNWLGEPSSQMFRAQFIDGGFDTSFNQIGDIEYNYRQLEHGDYYFVADELCSFRKHSDSWTTANRAELATYLEWLLLASKYRKYFGHAGISPDEYCLNFIKSWVRDLEAELHQEGRLNEQDVRNVLHDLCANKDPLSLFNYSKNAKREDAIEYKALSAMALLRSTLLEHEIRLIHEAIVRSTTEVELNQESLIKARPGLVAALTGLRQTLQARNDEIDVLRKVLTDVGSSLSWRVTEPLRKLIEYFR